MVTMRCCKDDFGPPTLFWRAPPWLSWDPLLAVVLLLSNPDELPDIPTAPKAEQQPASVDRTTVSNSGHDPDARSVDVAIGNLGSITNVKGCGIIARRLSLGRTPVYRALAVPDGRVGAQRARR